ncbi:MAG: hypothetical protein KJO96_08845 [Winogradskyella sp.]|nr:hypothetical protein [Winogradskyella sp.]
MIKRNILIVLITSLLSIGCERDDICADSTSTTPRLRIEFYDIANTDELKSVPRLTVFGEGLDETSQSIVSNTNTNALSLPLRFDLEGVTTTTRYILRKDANLDLDNDPATSSNEDVIEISYTPTFQYVSKACGYKAVFNDLSVTIISDSNNWALTEIINTSTVENENEVHAFIYH